MKVNDPAAVGVYVNVQLVPLVSERPYGVVPELPHPLPAPVTVPEFPPSEIVMVLGALLQFPVRFVIVKFVEAS